MKISRKSAASGSSTFPARFADADTLARSGESSSLDKVISSVSWATSDVSSTADLGLSHDKSQIVLAKEAAVNLVHGKIQELRDITGTFPNYFRPAHRDPFTHPNHLRRWHSKNLWCAYCQGSCAICDASCCAYFGAWKAYKNLSLSLEHRDWAYHLLKEISQWMTVGTDDATFMDCTTCRRLVCPSCCGICPQYPCYDRSCRSCKTEPWEPCDFHKNS